MLKAEPGQARSTRWWPMAALAALAVTAAVVVAAFGWSPNTATAATTVSFSRDIQPILTASCASCHGGERPSAGLRLEEGSAYEQLVNVQARPFRAAEGEEVAFEFVHVKPGIPEISYLMHKLLGTHEAVGGRGARMPRDADPLTDEQIDLFRQWILAGAPNN